LFPRRQIQNKYWRRLALTVIRRPLLIALPLIVLLVAMGLPFLDVNLGSPWAAVLPEEAPSRQGWDIVSDRMGPGELSPIILIAEFKHGDSKDGKLREIGDLTEILMSDPRVEQVDSILNPPLGTKEHTGKSPLKAISANPAESSTIVLTVSSKHSPVSDESRELVRTIRSMNGTLDYSLMVTGSTATIMDSIDEMYSNFPIAIIFVIVTVYVALFILFRSVVLPLKATVMNLMSIFASYGALVFIFQQGHFERLLGFTAYGVTEATIPIMLFAIIFGLSMDYEIFLLSRIKEVYNATGNTARSIAKGMEMTGPIITNSALILVLVSVAFATADIVIVKALGIGTAIAIFLDATVVRAFLVPSLMRLFDRWNWWLPPFINRIFNRW